MNTLDAIQQFKSALEPTDRQISIVSQRQQAVRARILAAAPFEIEDIYLHGSYARDTQIRPLATTTAEILYGVSTKLDVDAILIVKSNESSLNRYWRNRDSGTQLLNDLYGALRGFQGIRVELDRPSVTLEWADLKMEVSPAFNSSNGGYLIPARFSGDNWIHTDPLADAEKLSDANRNRQLELKPFTKMMKAWNRKSGKPMTSFGVETLAYYSTANFQGVLSEIHSFFGAAEYYNGRSALPPCGIGQPVSFYFNPSVQRHILASKDLASRAAFAFQNGNDRVANGCLAAIFGRPFPGA